MTEAERWFFVHQRHCIRWMHAYLDCLEERRPVTLLKTHWQLKGWLV